MREPYLKLSGTSLTHRLITNALPLALVIVLTLSHTAFASPDITRDPDHKLVTLSTGDGQLSLRLNYQDGCVLDQINVHGRNVAADSGACTGIQTTNDWLTTKTATGARVRVWRHTLTVSHITYGPPDRQIQETWKFTTSADRIIWQITRKYPAGETATDLAFPAWNFRDQTWTGGLLDNGGVVWNKYLDRPNATYGGHFQSVTFWNTQSNDCLRITPQFSPALFGAGRFSRQANNDFSFYYAINDEPFKTRHGQARFLGNRQDLWQPFQISPSQVTAKFELQALDYDKTYDRGAFTGLDGNNIRDLLNTVARYGVIDSHLVGGNGWRSGYICLHEPFVGQVAAALDATDYTANLAAALDFARDHAINADGRVKSRWCYGDWDAMPGTYDQYGFYEAQWGCLMDSQPDYVINVAELFNVTGDRQWLARHKDSCERALEFLTRREVGNTGLVTMMTDSCKQNRGSDWIDIIWASYENALINAELYAALNLWAGAETTLGDTARASDYRAMASRLKASFNRPTSEGGFWDPANQWYVYWRDKDGSIHGNNLVTPVNFAAIGYGLCDDPARQKAILDRMETEMNREKLFYWPLNFFPYAPEEGAASNFPFPKYENGDIFLSWGELAVRAYASYKPELALKYVENTLNRYSKDGLSFQRYLRQSQRGEGDDILSGNCMPIVGLYRDIYGLQPKPNRLYLEPHLTSALDGTQLRYTLRGQLYDISLNINGSSITAGHCTIGDSHPFALNSTAEGVQYFPGTNSDWAMSVHTPTHTHLAIEITTWPDSPDAPREWTESVTGTSGKISHLINGLSPGIHYQLYLNDHVSKTLKADRFGQLEFHLQLQPGVTQKMRLAPGH